MVVYWECFVGKPAAFMIFSASMETVRDILRLKPPTGEYEKNPYNHLGEINVFSCWKIDIMGNIGMGS
jgi:cytochrome b